MTGTAIGIIAHGMFGAVIVPVFGPIFGFGLVLFSFGIAWSLLVKCWLARFREAQALSVPNA